MLLVMVMVVVVVVVINTVRSNFHTFPSHRSSREGDARIKSIMSLTRKIKEIKYGYSRL